MRNLIQRMRDTRERATAIRATAKQFTRADHILTLETMKPTPRIPELPEPVYMLQTDAELESFLRRNNLTDALAEYIRHQHQRSSLLD